MQSVSISHSLQSDGGRPIGVRQNDVYHQIVAGQFGLVERPPRPIYYCYGAWQDGFELMKEHGVKFHEGIPDSELLPKLFQRVDYWSWTISWKKEGTTNACWICSPNIRIIRTLPSCICVRPCFHPVNTLRASPETPTTS